jgi:hypothetical protein
MERKGTIAIENLGNNASVAESLIRYGSSPLSVRDLTAEPQYTRAGVFKIFEESGAYDFSKPIKDVLYDPNDINSTKRRALIPDNILAEIEATLDSADNKLLEVLGKHYDDPTVRELFASAFNRMEINKSIDSLANTKPGGVGSAVNTLTMVGGTRDWIEQTIDLLPENQRNIILKNFQIGQLSAETFVDLSVGFAGTRQLATSAYEALEMSGPFANEEGVKIALAKTFGIEGVGGQFPAGFSITDIQEKILTDTGKQVGGTVYFAGLDRGVIDKEILNGRIFGDDVETFLRSIQQGMDEASSLYEAPLRTKKGDIRKGLTQEQLDELAQLTERKQNLSSQIDEILKIQKMNAKGEIDKFATSQAIHKRATELLGFDEDHEFAYLSRQQKEITKTHEQLTQQKTNALRESYKKEIDYFAGETQEDIAKARQAAQKLIEDRRSLLKNVLSPKNFCQIQI